MNRWSYEPLGNNVVTAGLLIAVLLVLLALVPTFGKPSFAKRAILGGLRLLTILLVVPTLLRPTHVFERSAPRASFAAILFDTSRSMTLPDRADGSTRWQSQSAALETLNRTLASFPEHTEVRAYAYDSSLRALEFSGGGFSLPAAPLGEATDPGAALEELLRREAGKRLAGLFLLGDGTQTSFASGADSQAAARRVRDEFAAPLFAVPFGPAGDAAQAKDVAIDRLEEQYVTFEKNEITVRGRIKVSGYTGRSIPISLTVTDAAGKEREAAALQAAVKKNDESIELAIPYLPSEPGHFKLTVRAAQQPGETVVKNNALSAYLTVLKGGLRVFFIDSGKRAEQKFIRRSLNESPDIELDAFSIDSLNRERWPIDFGAAWRSTKYDVVILGNVPAEALGEKNMRELASFVESGRGFIALGGTRALGAGNYRGTPLENVLPIVFDRFEKQEFTGADREDLFLAGPLAIRPAVPHSITHFREGNSNESVWRKLPPLDFANRFTGVKEAPGVRILADGPKREPLLVTGEYGGGRVLVFAGSSTYRWSLHGFAAEHKRFWRQAVLWAARRDESQTDDVWLKLPQRRYEAGANVTFTCGARNPEGDRVSDAVIAAVITEPSGKKRTLRVSPTSEGFSGNFQAGEPGDYAIEIVASAQGRTLGNAKAEFLILDQDLELSRVAADHDHLARLAQITADAGGEVIAPEKFEDALKRLAAKPPEMETQTTKWRFGDGAGTAWPWLLAFTCSLGCEWWLRKKWGMV